MVEVIPFRSRQDESREKCLKLLENMLVRLRKRKAIGVAIVSVYEDDGLGTAWEAYDPVKLLGGISRLMADMNRKLDEVEQPYE